MYTSTVRVAAATLPVTGGPTIPLWVVFVSVGGLALLGGLGLRLRRLV